MKILFISTLALVFGSWISNHHKSKEKLSKNIYDYSFTNIDGQTVHLSDYKGKKILFVNTASLCGFTPQYKELQDIHIKYASKLVVLGFPCNQFGFQEPKSGDSIKSFCKKNYGVTFMLSEKIAVKGPEKHPIYQWLTEKALNNVEDTEVKWNFQKYLVDEKGNYVKMFPSKVKPDDPELVAAIEK